MINDSELLRIEDMNQFESDDLEVLLHKILNYLKHITSADAGSIYLKDEDFLMSYAADRLSIALPLYAGMTNEEFDYVISNIKEALK